MFLEFNEKRRTYFCCPTTKVEFMGRIFDVFLTIEAEMMTNFATISKQKGLIENTT